MNCIKTNNKWNRQRGTTLIELSVVIAVILLLVGVLFIGITAWKDGANKAACIVNLATIQKAVRGYENMNSLKDGDAAPVATLTTAGFWAVQPTCPAGGTYTFTGTVPVAGTPYAVCSLAAATAKGHAPLNTNNW
jgi:prepilin-type N-terminal cleavage/methylation domain-containing protein